MESFNVLAIIPARGGSKGIRKKNLRLLNGRPLIYYQIQNALNCSFDPDVVVTSDSSEILDYAASLGVELRERPSELAGDDVTLDPVIFDALEYMEKIKEKKYDIVITLQPTSPLLRIETLDNVIKKLISNKLDTVIPVMDSTHLFWKEEKGSIVPDYSTRLNRQLLPKRYVETGAFLITRRRFVTNNSRFGKKIDVYIMNKTEGVDIDEKIDWIFAETLMKRRKITFVVNGNKQIAMGHIYRVINLAEQLIGHDISIITYQSDDNAIKFLENTGHTVLSISKNELISTIVSEKPDILINDILDTSKNYVMMLKKLNLFVVNFEDLGSGADHANLVINALYEKTNHKDNYRFSYEYECIGERYLLRKPIKYNKGPCTLLITFGGVDQNNISHKILKMAPEIITKSNIKKLIMVVGIGYAPIQQLNELRRTLGQFEIAIHQNVDDMPKLLSSADLAITSNGRTIYELAAMGIPTISIAQNDRETLHLFARYSKGVKYLGIAQNVTSEMILDALVRISKDTKLRRSMYDSQLISGGILRTGCSRVIYEILAKYREWRNENHQDW